MGYLDTLIQMQDRQDALAARRQQLAFAERQFQARLNEQDRMHMSRRRQALVTLAAQIAQTDPAAGRQLLKNNANVLGFDVSGLQPSPHENLRRAAVTGDQTLAPGVNLGRIGALDRARIGAGGLPAAPPQPRSALDRMLVEYHALRSRGTPEALKQAQELYDNTILPAAKAMGEARGGAQSPFSFLPDPGAGAGDGGSGGSAPAPANPVFQELMSGNTDVDTMTEEIVTHVQNLRAQGNDAAAEAVIKGYEQGMIEYGQANPGQAGAVRKTVDDFMLRTGPAPEPPPQQTVPLGQGPLGQVAPPTVAPMQPAVPGRSNPLLPTMPNRAFDPIEMGARGGMSIIDLLKENVGPAITGFPEFAAEAGPKLGRRILGLPEE